MLYQPQGVLCSDQKKKKKKKKELHFHKHFTDVKIVVHIGWLSTVPPLLYGLTFLTALGSKYNYHLPFKDEETEAERHFPKTLSLINVSPQLWVAWAFSE